MILSDTILALSSAPGADGIRAIVRLSGPGAHALARAATDLALESCRGYFGHISLRLLPPGNRLAALLLFQGPRSFTGQDVAELHIPNSPALVRAVMDDLLSAARADGIAARPAGPGEFSARAFFNGKIDLTQAEGIAATISATSNRQLRAAASLRAGNLHRYVEEHADKIADLLARVEAGIDFSDEADVTFITAGELLGGCKELGVSITGAISRSPQWERLDAMPSVVLTGRPNVGKSSLINALAGNDRALVSAVRGTTRDALSAIAQTPKGPVRLVDIAGWECGDSDLQLQMNVAGQRALAEADLIVYVRDPQNASNEDDFPPQLYEGNAFRFTAAQLTVWNKTDTLAPPSEDPGRWSALPHLWVRVSAITGFNIDTLREWIGELAFRTEATSALVCTLNRRHMDLLHGTARALGDASVLASDSQTFARNQELVASELRRALDFLGQITGTISPDEVLGRIFSRFCIGK